MGMGAGLMGAATPGGGIGMGAGLMGAATPGGGMGIGAGLIGAARAMEAVEANRAIARTTDVVFLMGDLLCAKGAQEEPRPKI